MKRRLKVAKHFNIDPLRLLPPIGSAPLDGCSYYLDVCTYKIYGFDHFRRRYFTEPFDAKFHYELWKYN